jgi:FAD synthetase
MTPMKNKGILFGAFDGFHLGHQKMICDAFKEAKNLTISLASENSIRILKKREPRFSTQERVDALKANFPQVQIIIGDDTPGTYSVLKSEKFDIIIVGHDQEKLQENIKAWQLKNNINVPILQLLGYNEDKFKSSKIYDRN